MADSSNENRVELTKSPPPLEQVRTPEDIGDHSHMSADELRLERFGNNLENVGDGQIDDDDDDEDEEQHNIAHHPLLGMLAGRLGAPRRRGSSHKYDHLHPVTSIINVSSVDECYDLEMNFPEEERASREKFEYRLSTCPELTLGIFTQLTKVEAAKAGKPSKRKLIAMVVATRTPAPCVTDASMGIPKDWKTNNSTIPKPGQTEKLGHQDVGGTIALHSLMVSPDHRNKGLGSVLMKSYIQRIKDSRIADRIALIAHPELESFYTNLGFDNMGPSTCTWGGGGWSNMILEFSDVQDD